jgi:thioredoxin-like negative regulator of GroEL
MAFSSEIEKLERRWQENPLGLTFASLAELYRKAGETARALELIEQGLTQHPNYVPAHIVRARCYLDSQSDSDAEVAFLRVTELDPENVMALKGLAELSERAGRIPEAVQRLQLLLDVDRNNEEAKGHLDRVKELLASGPAPVASPEPATPAPSWADAVVAEPVATSETAFVAARDPEPVPETESNEPLEDISLGDLELETASQLTAMTSDEFQVANDSENLRSSDERIADVVLGTEPPEEFPIDDGGYVNRAETAPSPPPSVGMDSVDVLLGEGYESLMAYRDPSTVPDVEPSNPEETVFGQMALMESAPTPTAEVPPPPTPNPTEEGHSPEESPSVAGWAELEIPDAGAAAEVAETPQGHAADPEPGLMFAEPEPEPELAPESPAVEATSVSSDAEPTASGMVEDYVPLGDLGAPTPYQPAAPQSEEPEPVSTDEPELVVTETMAEIFLRQGHRELALAVYAQLAQREPENERIAAAVARLTPETPAPQVPAAAPAPRFAATETGGRSVGHLFGALLSGARPAVTPAIHPPAFEQPRRNAGEPTRPAQDTLSLSSVFGEESTATGAPAPAADSNSGEPSFDEFFAPATGAATDLELPRGPEGESAGMPAQVPEDLEQFNAWLRGLKR